MSKIIQQLEQEQLRTDIPAFAPGDTVRVNVRVKEGDKERLQAFLQKRAGKVLPDTSGA